MLALQLLLLASLLTVELPSLLLLQLLVLLLVVLVVVAAGAQGTPCVWQQAEALQVLLALPGQ